MAVNLRAQCGTHTHTHCSVPVQLVLSLFKSFNVVAQLQGGPQLQSHVFHDHITPQ